MNLNPGSWLRVGLRALVVIAISSAALWMFYNHYDVTRDPKTSAIVAAAVAAYDKLMKWFNADQDAEYWRQKYESLQREQNPPGPQSLW